MDTRKWNVILLTITIWSLTITTINSYPNGGESINYSFDKFARKFSEIALSDNKNGENIACFPYGLAMLLFAIATRADVPMKNNIKSILNLDKRDDDYLTFQIQSLDINIKSQIQTGASYAAVNMLGSPRGIAPHHEFNKNILEILHIQWSHDLDGSFVPSTNVQITGEVQINPYTNFRRQKVNISHRNTYLVFLANALYLKGQWENPFTGITYGPFYAYSRIIDYAPMISQINFFRHGVIPELQIEFIELPYANSAGSMFIIMPRDDMYGLNRLEGKLENFGHMMSRSSQNKELIELLMPKFRIDTFISLKNYLDNIGLANMFTSTGVFDFVKNIPIQLADSYQKIIIEVDDTIREANVPFGHNPRKVIVNRPFIAMIALNNMVIASAKINDPLL